jgi:hypothetical protein
MTNRTKSLIIAKTTKVAKKNKVKKFSGFFVYVVVKKNCAAKYTNFTITSQFQNVQFCPRSRKAKILTTGIPGVFRGLKFEPDAEIGQKGAF